MFKKICVVLLVMVVLLFLNHSCTFAKTFYYRVEEEKGTRELIYRVEEKQDYIIIEGVDGERKLRYELNKPDLETISSEVLINEEETEIKMEGKDEQIFISAKSQGTEIDKIIEVEQEKWYQLFSFSLQNFVLSEDNKIDFISISSNDQNKNKMFAEKKEREIIEIAGQEYEAYRVEVRLRGFFRFFWVNEYWFRVTDGVFLKQIGELDREGGEVTVELKKIKD